MVTRSYHPTKGAANAAAQRWKRKGFRVFVEMPYKDMGANRKYRVTTEGRGSKKYHGRVYDIAKTQKKDVRDKNLKKYYSKSQIRRFSKS